MEYIPSQKGREQVFSKQESQRGCLGDPHFVHFIRNCDSHQYRAASRAYFAGVYRCVHAVFLKISQLIIWYEYDMISLITN